MLTLRIKDLRTLRGMTQQELADIIGASKPHVSGLERGVKNLNNHTIERLASALGVQPFELFVPPESETLSEIMKVFLSLPDDRRDELGRYAEYLQNSPTDERAPKPVSDRDD